jgi:hypothetical protein
MDTVLAWIQKHRPEWVAFMAALIQGQGEINGKLARAMIVVGFRAGEDSVGLPVPVTRPVRTVRPGAMLDFGRGMDVAGGEEEPKQVTDMRHEIMRLKGELRDAREELADAHDDVAVNLDLMKDAQARGTEMRDQLHEVVAKEEGEGYGTAMEESPLPWDEDAPAPGEEDESVHDAYPDDPADGG